MEIFVQYRQEYNRAFRQMTLATDRARDLRIDLELISDALAGPLLSILSNGNCNYVFRDRGNRFPGVTNADEFRIWGLKLAKEYHDAVNKFIPANSAEEDDLKSLKEKSDGMKRAVEIAYQIQKQIE